MGPNWFDSTDCSSPWVVKHVGDCYFSVNELECMAVIGGIIH